MASLVRPVIGLLIASAVSTAAMAADHYLAFDAGKSLATGTCNAAGLPAGSAISDCNNSGHIYRLAVGHQFTRAWGAELSYSEYGNSSLGVATLPGGGKLHLDDWKLSGPQFTATFLHPVTSSFSVTAKAGVAYTKYTLFSPALISANKAGLTVGFGVLYELNRHLDIRTQFEHLGRQGDPAVTGTINATLLSVGLSFKY
jgi:opacity protein-like surface antigen